MAPQSDQWFTVKEAARILKVHPNFVYALVRKGQLEAGRLGRVIRISREALSLVRQDPREIGERSPSCLIETDRP
jgi:excisionase family DNA binding protein